MCLRKPVRAGGKPSLTDFEVLARGGTGETQISLVLCRPQTGRSHQIRVHLAGAGWPIVGDKRYGPGLLGLDQRARYLAAVHHMLHSRRIYFPMDREPIEAVAPLPPHYSELVALLGFE